MWLSVYPHLVALIVRVFTEKTHICVAVFLPTIWHPLIHRVFYYEVRVARRAVSIGRFVNRDGLLRQVHSVGCCRACCEGGCFFRVARRAYSTWSALASKFWSTPLAHIFFVFALRVACKMATDIGTIDELGIAETRVVFCVYYVKKMIATLLSVHILLSHDT